MLKIILIINAILLIIFLRQPCFYMLKYGKPYLTLLMQSPPRHLDIPVENAKAESLDNSWNAPREEGRKHKGIDILAPLNSKIYSPTKGIVHKIGWGRGGNYVTILGPRGYRYYYAHLERFGEIRVGELVRAGETIGFIGNSGNARNTPPHLHFGIYNLWGGPVNPYSFLAHGNLENLIN